MHPISPSQIKLYRQCHRSFAFRYVEGIRSPQSEAMKHGTLMHTMMELYLLRGMRPKHVHAMAALPEAPKPLTALAEAKIKWQLAHPWTYQGIMDFSGALISKANFTTSPFMHDFAQPIVIGDFKFTSDLKYRLRESEGVLIDHDSGEIDPQSTMYASRYFHLGYESVHGKWIYSRTKQKAKAMPVWVDFRKDRIMEEMAGPIARDAGEIHQLYQIRPKANDVAYDRNGCFAFNTVCPHIGYCNRSVRMFDCAETDAEPVGEEDMGFAEDFMKNFPGEGAPPSETDEEIPDLEGDEIPEVAEDERDAPTEEEMENLIKAELAANRVEKGFVNPPEAPDTAAATPAEAFEMHGDPVVEKPKKEKALRAPKEKVAKPEKMKFGSKQRGKLFAEALKRNLVAADSDDRAPALAKLLEKEGVDLAAMFPELVPAPPAEVEIVSQDGVTEEEIPLLDEPFVDTTGEEVPDVEEDIPDFEDDMDAHDGVVPELVDDVEHNLTGDQLEKALTAAIQADACGAPGAAEEVERLESLLPESDFDGPTEERARFSPHVSADGNVARTGPTDAPRSASRSLEPTRVARLSVVEYRDGLVYIEGFSAEPLHLTVGTAALLRTAIARTLETIVMGKIIPE